MPFDVGDLAYLKSFRDEDCFAVAAKKFLAIVEEEYPAIADDLREIIALVLDKQKTYTIVAQDKDGRKRINFAAYDAAFRDWKEGEARLVAASERLFEKYKDDPAQMQTLAMVYAKCVSLLPATKNTSRENLLDIYRARRDSAVGRGSVTVRDRVPGGILNYLMPNPEPDKNWDENLFPRPFTFGKIKEFITGVDKTVLKPVLTAHPTNINRGDYLQLLLDFASASREITRGKDGSLGRYEQALANLISTPMAPTTDDGLPACFTPADETDMEMLALENIYHNMSGPRRIFDEALRNRAALRADIPDIYTAKKRLALHLNVEPMSWVMGDKDGNPNIKSEHLLRSIVLRRRNIVRLYLADIRQLKEQNKISLPLRSDGSSWEDLFVHAEENLNELFNDIEQAKRDMDIPLSQSNFDSLMQESSLVFKSLNVESTAQEFVTALEKTFPKCTKKQKDKLITLIDRARSFRLNFAALGLREDAEEYTNILGFLFEKSVPALDYKALSEKEKIDLLDKYFQNPKGLADRIMSFLATIENTEGLREYNPDDPSALTYHTLKRLELAAHHPDAVSDMILAEFRHPSNILEALVLQKAISIVVKKPLLMAVVPLFEEFETLEDAGDMLWSALKTKAFRQHLLAVAGYDPTAIKLFIQIAHSDNNRRAGAPASRVSIYDVHHSIPHLLQEQYKRIKTFFDKDEEDKLVADRISMENLVITPEFFEGRSQTDSTRGGERAQTSLANLYNQHRCAKETFQGIDVLAYLQLPESFTRMVSRTLSHNAARMAIKDATHQPEALRRIPEIEAAVIQAFKRTVTDYTKMHFDKAGNLFGHPLVNGTLNRDMYNRGCRTATRGGDQKDRPDAREKPMSHKKMRAIAFGNNFLDAGVHPAILSTLNVESYLVDAFADGSVALKKLEFEAAEFGNKGIVKNKNGSLTPVGYKTLFSVSPGFRDVIHFIQTGCGATSLEHTLRRFEEAEAKKNLPINADLKDYVTKALPRELAAAAKLVLGTNGYALPEDLEKSMETGTFTPDQCACLSFLVRTISGIAPESTLNSGLAILPQVLRDNIIMRAALRKSGAFTDDDFKTLNHVAEATLSDRHIRIFSVDDPHTGAARAKEEIKQSSSRPDYFHYLMDSCGSAGQNSCVMG
jgi:hypothetical protein